MKIKELRKLDTDKLQEQLTELKNKSRELRFSIANSQLKDVRSLRVVKYDIAKILTILKQRQTEAPEIDKELTQENTK